MIDKEVFHLNGGVGDILCVYEDRVVIQHKGVLNFFTMGMKGDKTLYYADITSVQFKKPGLLSGYIQFSLPGGKEDTGGLSSAFQDENTITLSGNAAEAEKVVNYINQRLREVKTNKVQATFSPADELRKFKELLDMGIISQQEFDAKKKQLIG
jgi:hypothetical protein